MDTKNGHPAFAGYPVRVIFSLCRNSARTPCGQLFFISMHTDRSESFYIVISGVKTIKNGPPPMGDGRCWNLQYFVHSLDPDDLSQASIIAVYCCSACGRFSVCSCSAFITGHGIRGTQPSIRRCELPPPSLVKVNGSPKGVECPLILPSMEIGKTKRSVGRP